MKWRNTPNPLELHPCIEQYGQTQGTALITPSVSFDGVNKNGRDELWQEAPEVQSCRWTLDRYRQDGCYDLEESADSIFAKPFQTEIALTPTRDVVEWQTERAF